MAGESEEVFELKAAGAFEDDGFANFDMGNDLNIPVVALMRLFEVAADLDFIKNCRFVCKTWNEIACRWLREHTQVKLRDDTPQRSLEFLEILKAHSRLGLPSSPFQKVCLTVTNFDDHSLTSFLRDVGANAQISGLTLSPGVNFKIREFHQVLEPNKNALSHLKIVTDESGFEFMDESSRTFPCNLPALDSLKVIDQCDDEDDCHHCDYLRSLLSRASPKNLFVVANSANVLANVLRGYEMNTKLTTLAIKIDLGSWPTLEFAEVIGALAPTDCLHSLRIVCSIPEPFLQGHIAPLFRRVQPFLKNLICDCVSVQDFYWGQWPMLQELKTLVVKGNFSEFSLAKFPRLTALGFRIKWNQLPHNYSWKMEPHGNVRAVEVEQRGAENKSVMNAKALDFFRCLKHHFPKVSSLTLKLQVFSPQILVGLLRTFPRIQHLHFYLNDCGNPEDFTGIWDVIRFRRLGWDFEEWPRGPSLADFQDLETLTLWTTFPFDEDLVRYCLSRIPKLQYLYVSEWSARDGREEILREHFRNRVNVSVTKYLGRLGGIRV